MAPEYRALFIIIMTGFILAFALAVVGSVDSSWIGGSRLARRAVFTSMTPTDVVPAAPTRTPTVMPTAASAETPSGSALTLVGKDIAFDNTSLQAKAGDVRIEFHNQDDNVTHNLHLFRGSDPSGQSVGMTAITPGPDTQTLVVVLTQGAYFYHCDVHPTQMTGNLTVK